MGVSLTLFGDELQKFGVLVWVATSASAFLTTDGVSWSYKIYQNIIIISLVKLYLYFIRDLGAD